MVKQARRVGLSVGAALSSTRLAVLAASISLVGCGSEEPELPKPRNVQTMTATANEQAVTRRFVGTLRAAERAQLAFEVGGVVETVGVELGDRFAKGDVLAALDPAQAEARASAARSALGEARATLKNAEADAVRYLSLRGSGAIAESEIDQAVTRRDTAQDNVRRLGAELEQAQDRLADYTLVARYDGRVVDRMVEPSDVVAAGETVLAVAGDQGLTEAAFAVPERYLGVVARGKPATVRITSSAQTIEGEVVEVASGAGTAGLIDVVVALPGTDLTPGTRVEVALLDDSLPRGIVLPVGSFASVNEETARVFVLDGQTVRAREVVVTGLTDRGLIATSGLNEGETIVAKGANRLRDGETVTPVGKNMARYDG